jgi:hypothetical protein
MIGVLRADAVRIAEAVLTPIYGEKAVESRRPFLTSLKNGVWIVHGRIHHAPGENLWVEVFKKTGCILRL